MNRTKLGSLLVFIGIFGGGFLWVFLCGLRFDYLIHEVYEGGIGEPIWVMDAGFTVISALPAFFLVLSGLVVSIWPHAIGESERVIHDNREIVQRNQQISLLYIGETSILVATLVSLLTFYYTVSSTVYLVFLASIMFGFFTLSGGLHHINLVFHLLLVHYDTLASSHVMRATTVMLLVGLLYCASTSLGSPYDIIRNSGAVILVSGLLGLLFIAPFMIRDEIS